jgi:hypothetical protein
MIEDVRMGRMICMTTRERDAEYIADSLRAFDPPNAGIERPQKPQEGRLT